MNVTTDFQQLVIDWITGLGWDTREDTGYPLLPGPEIITEPDKVVFITGTGGPGFMAEAALDEGTFQARLRGPSDDVTTAGQDAKRLDIMILNALFPIQVDGVWIVNAYRSGGRPQPLPLDPGDRRFEFTANYVIITSTGA